MKIHRHLTSGLAACCSANSGSNHNCKPHPHSSTAVRRNGRRGRNRNTVTTSIAKEFSCSPGLDLADVKPVKQLSISVAVSSSSVHRQTTSASGQLLNSGFEFENVDFALGFGRWASAPQYNTLHYGHAVGLNFTWTAQVTAAQVESCALNFTENDLLECLLILFSCLLSDDEAPAKTAKDAGARRPVYNNEEDEETKIDIGNFKIDPDGAPASSHQTSYEISCLSNINRSSISQSTHDGPESNQHSDNFNHVSVKLEQEHRSYDSDDEETGPRDTFCRCQNCTQLISFMKRDEHLIGLQQDSENRESSAPALEDTNHQGGERNDDAMGFEILKESDANSRGENMTNERPRDRTTSTDEPDHRTTPDTSDNSNRRTSNSDPGPSRDHRDESPNNSGMEKEDRSTDFLNYLFAESSPPPSGDLDTTSNNNNDNHGTGHANDSPQRVEPIPILAAVPLPSSAALPASDQENLGAPDLGQTDLEQERGPSKRPKRPIH
ncbi:hypothetical protein PSTG_01331 [Puccinia striiformis f. sp. tritici PST-78]|uniref:Uncharacterized protein n=2 Tax=Puccinia striiformis f. sp. tritici TaxID=168172 RepID=A0A0L0W1Y9_9BASI|nr:hypothetical protein PSTG_01331 [Puccinia striiformis f. sp. tritici PST-78]